MQWFNRVFSIPSFFCLKKVLQCFVGGERGPGLSIRSDWLGLRKEYQGKNNQRQSLGSVFSKFFSFLNKTKQSFIVISPEHTCAIIMLFNQHLCMQHLSGGWIILAREKCSLLQILRDL